MNFTHKIDMFTGRLALGPWSNSDLAGMPISLLMLFSVVYSVFVITLQMYLIIYQSMTTIVSLKITFYYFIFK